MFQDPISQRRHLWRRLIYVLLTLLALAGAAAAMAKPAMIWIARKQIGKVFPGAQVSIGASRISPLHRVSLLDVIVKREGAYSLRIGAITADYTPTSLLKRTILKAAARQVRLDVTLPRKTITDLAQYINLGSQGRGGGFEVKDLELSGLSSGVHLKDIAFEVRASAAFSLADCSLRSLELSFPFLEAKKFLLSDGALSLNPGSGPNEFYVPKLQYDKVKVDGLHGRLSLQGDQLLAEDLSVAVFDGQVKGRAELAIGLPTQYRASLVFTNLDLAKFVDAFDLRKKFLMTGWLGGRMELGGNGADIRILSGTFAMTKAGGTLIITDPTILENIASRTGQRMEILVDSFRDYHYNTGIVSLLLEDNNLSVDMALEGEAGKRDLNIVVHDLQTKKDGL